MVMRRSAGKPPPARSAATSASSASKAVDHRVCGEAPSAEGEVLPPVSQREATDQKADAPAPAVAPPHTRLSTCSSPNQGASESTPPCAAAAAAPAQKYELAAPDSPCR